MKALSLTQPMAWAIFHGKDVENRTWPTKFRGRIMVHASKKFDWEHYNWIVENGNRLVCFPPAFKHDFVFGALIGEVDVIDCVRGHTSRWAFPNQYNFVLANATEYKIPIPCRGKLGLFEPDVE